MSSSKKYVNRVIVVYTCDWTDKEDVMRVRKRLREIGFTEEIYYKTNDMTRRQIYGQEERDQAPYRD